MHCDIELLCIAIGLPVKYHTGCKWHTVKTRLVTLLSTKMLNSTEKIVMHACREELVME